MAGLSFLILLLYVIGKNQNLFGSTFLLKVRFENVGGLTAGSNVRFAGIDAGSVRRVEVLNDTTIEVSLLIKTKMKDFIHRNAEISIGTDGLIGNRVVNIEATRGPSPLVSEGDVLQGAKSSGADEMLKVLNKTNNDLAITVQEIRQTVEHINRSKAIWTILDDATIPLSLRQTLERVKASSTNLDQTMRDLSLIVSDVKSGKGSLGKLVRDSSIALAAVEAIDKVKNIGAVVDSLSGRINVFVDDIHREVVDGRGTVHSLLKDPQMTQRLESTMKNLEQDTKAVNEVLEAIKHSFLFRGYFRKLEKQKTEPLGLTRKE